MARISHTQGLEPVTSRDAHFVALGVIGAIAWIAKGVPFLMGVRIALSKAGV